MIWVVAPIGTAERDDYECDNGGDDRSDDSKGPVKVQR